MSSLPMALVESSPSDDAHLRLDEQICFPLYASGNLIARLYRPLLQPLGLTYPQYLVMLVLWEQQPCSVTLLGERLMLDSGTLTPLLKRLASAGWVSRQRDPADERRVLIALTPAGEALRDAARGVPQALACRLLAVAPDPAAAAAQAPALRSQLQGLVRSLQLAVQAQQQAEP